MRQFDDDMFATSEGHTQFNDAVFGASNGAARQVVPVGVKQMPGTAPHGAATPSLGQGSATRTGAKLEHPAVSSLIACDPGYLKVVYFDASAIVKLLLNDGTESSVEAARMLSSDTSVVKYTTAICFAETLQVLKRKRFFPMKTDVPLTAEQYTGLIFSLYAMVGKHGSIRMENIEIGWDLLAKSDDFVDAYGIDHSDALQIATIQGKDGRSWTIGTILCTADQKLADAAAAESIPVAYLR